MRIAKSEGDEEIDLDYTEIKAALGQDDDSTDYERVTYKINLILSLQGKGDPGTWEPGLMSPFDVILEETWEETVQVMNNHWTIIEAIAKALLEKRTMTGRQVGDIWEALEPDDE